MVWPMPPLKNPCILMPPTSWQFKGNFKCSARQLAPASPHSNSHNAHGVNVAVASNAVATTTVAMVVAAAAVAATTAAVVAITGVVAAAMQTAVATSAVVAAVAAAMVGDTAAAMDDISVTISTHGYL